MPLKPGDRVRIVAPAGHFGGQGLLLGVEKLHSWGLAPVWREDILSVDSMYLAGTDDRRAAELIEAFEDPECRAILCARGGYGAMRILDRISDEILRADPKPVIGFSDISAMHWDFFRRVGLRGMSAPMAAGSQLRDIHPEPEAWYRSLLFDDGPWRKENFARVMHGGGVVEGPLFPTNLTMLTMMLAAGRLPDLTGAILVVEDVNEPAYRIDRMLTVLRLAGVVDRVGAILFGELMGVDDESVARLVRELATRDDIVVAEGAPLTHGDFNEAVPFGVRASFDAGDGALTIHESIFDPPAAS